MPFSRDRYIVLGLAVMAAVMLVPFLSVTIPPLTDLPNHISRLHILSTLGDDPDLQKNYLLDWGLIPNLAMDVLSLPLTWMASPYAAGKTFAILTFVTGLLGMFALHYAAWRSVNAWSGVVYFVAYNQAIMFGLLNFYFGVGLAFLLLAAWIMYARKHPGLMLWFFPLGALAVYFSHLLAFGAYGILIAGYELSVLIQSGERRLSTILRRAACAGCQFVVPVAILMFTAESKTGLEGATEYASALNKTASLFAPVRVYIEALDLATILFLIIAIVLVWWRKRLRIAPNLGIPLAVIAILALATPSLVLSIFGIDQRFAIIGGMLFFAVIRIEFPARGPASLLLAVGIGLLVWRSVDLTIHWRQFDTQFSELRAAARVMERGAGVLPVQRRTRIAPLGSNFTYWHIASLAVVERSLFNPQTFTARHQPIKAHPDRELMDCVACRPPTPADLATLSNPEISWEILELPYERQYFYRHAAQWPDRYDYILVVDFGDHRNPLPKLLTPRHTGSFFVIYENRNRPRG